jgi:pilus assembly protein CpaD
MRISSHIFGKLLAAAAIGAFASACAKKSVEITASIPTDYRDRHPIVIVPAEESVDIFVRGTSGKLDTRQLDDIKSVAQDYQANGQGHMSLLVPSGGNGYSQAAVNTVRSTLNRSGVRAVHTSHYRVEGPARDQPIRIVYTKLKARTATKCGQWPKDIHGVQGAENWNNEQYYNFGCAYQNMIASQVAEPLDLVRGRTETPADTARRIQVIQAQRSGTDASTEYRQTGTTINTAVGTN